MTQREVKSWQIARDRWIKQDEIVQRVGGFFVCVNEMQQSFSGPWRTQLAAELARDEKYDEAHQEERRHD